MVLIANLDLKTVIQSTQTSQYKLLENQIWKHLRVRLFRAFQWLWEPCIIAVTLIIGFSFFRSFIMISEF